MFYLQYLSRNIFLAAFIVVSLDIITTAIGLFYVGLCERNQNVVMLIDMFGVYGLLLWYPIEVLCVYLASYILLLMRCKLFAKSSVKFRFECIPIFLMCYVVLNNTVLILSNTFL